MLGFVNKWFVAGANPIGVDFGTDTLKMAQVQMVAGDPRLIAAASADVPSHIRRDPQARMTFFVQTVRDLLAQGNFRGKQAILALPAANMHIQHLRLPRMDEQATRKALPWEARGKLPIDPNSALLRHILAGEVYQEQEQKNEIILMAASRDLVNGFLEAAAKAKLDVIGMNVEPLAVVNCFGHIYRRKTDAELISAFIDMGCSSTRVFIARGSQIFFARAIPVGGEQLNRAVADGMGIALEDARLLRLRLCHQAPGGEHQPKNDLAGNAPSQNTEQTHASRADEQRQPAAVALADPSDPSANSSELSEQASRVEHAIRPLLEKLVQELDLCRRYYETTFPAKPVDRLIFVGGEARHRSLCQFIAQQLGLAAQVGDPLVRMGRVSEVGIESGIDRRQPQPAWTVPIGLSLGPVTEATAKAAESRN